ncbi:MAG: Tetratricopeptide repeat protein [Acidobacteria bacterium]|nr:Tetratricopeptide repeat protein [Acidobacteriota bacterium]
MSEIAKSAELSVEEIAVNTSNDYRTSIRVSPNGYFIALFLATFFSAFLIYLKIDWAAIALFGLSWISLPFLLWSDRIEFDGKKLFRTGILPSFWAFLNNSRTRLKLRDIEQVETQAIRTLRRGGNIVYRYRTSIRGKDVQFSFASGNENYRQMVQRIFPVLSENALDNRSIELRDSLAEPKETLMKAAFAQIPSAEVLESSLNEDALLPVRRTSKPVDSDQLEKAEYLHRLGNELRLSGFLIQALEAFRRALVLNPKDARLLFDFARCLNSYAGSQKSKKLQRKSIAALRLVEKRAEGNAELLARLGESYFQFGDYRRAKIVFQRTLDKAGESFRSVRGLAEIALREGKIAHVIHHFSTASRLAETTALKRWTRNESEYFSRLNDDDDYMEMEINRVSLLETLENSQKTALKIALFGFPFILMGVVGEESAIANLGWAISNVSLLIWVGLMMSQKMLSGRIPFELLEEED